MEATHLVVARFLKPHGLRGAALVEPLTDEPETVFEVGRRLWRVDTEGRVVGDPLVVRRSRAFKAGWLLELEDCDSRTALEREALMWLGAPRTELLAPGPEAMYLHELIGAVVMEGEVRIGVVSAVVGGKANPLLAVDVGGREQLIPFRRPIVRSLDRAGRRVMVELPPGLLDV